METFEIINHYGNSYGYVNANNAREALCKYLMAHEELEDMMLYKDAFWGMWKLAEYDNEETYFVARKVRTI